MAMFKEVADIKTADMLDLPVPKAVYHNISVKPSEIQKQMVAELAERAEKVRNGMVDASVDNMLKITNDGRKLALDQRLINPMLPDFEGSKLNACVDAMLDIIFGQFFIAYAPIESENFQSLPKNLAEKYKEKFKYPERIAKVNGEIVAVPFKPKTKEAER